MRKPIFSFSAIFSFFYIHNNIIVVYIFKCFYIFVYNESRQAWGNLFLKNELINEFPQLKEKRAGFSYQLIYHRDPKELQKAIQKMINNGKEIMPILMFLYKENE